MMDLRLGAALLMDLVLRAVLVDLLLGVLLMDLHLLLGAALLTFRSGRC